MAALPVVGVKRGRDEMTSDAPSRPPFTLHPVPPAITAAVRTLCLRLIFRDRPFNDRKYGGPRPELPGPLAVTLSRRTLREVVARQPYVVCEKSDGERQLLLAVARPVGCVDGRCGSVS